MHMQLGLLYPYEYNQDPPAPAPGPKRGRRKKKRKVLAVSSGARRSWLSRCPTHQTHVSDPPAPTARRVAVRHNHRFRVVLSGARLRVTTPQQRLSMSAVGKMSPTDSSKHNWDRFSEGLVATAHDRANCNRVVGRTGLSIHQKRPDRVWSLSISGYCDSSDFAAARLGQPTPSLSKGAGREHVPAFSSPPWKLAVPFSMVPPVYSY